MPRKPKATPEDLRIYVVVAETVQVLTKSRGKISTRSIKMEPGRNMAQGEHVVSKMRMEEIEALGTGPITTINLSVRNSKELNKVLREFDDDLIKVFTFSDENPKFYGTRNRVFTALCTLPTTKEAVELVIGHLELFGKER